MNSKIIIFIVGLLLLIVLSIIGGGVYYFLSNNSEESSEEQFVEAIPEYLMKDIFDPQVTLGGECNQFEVNNFGITDQLVSDILEDRVEYNFLVGLAACTQIDQDTLDEIYDNFFAIGEQCFADFSENQQVVEEAYDLLTNVCANNNLSRVEYDQLINYIREQQANGLIDF